MASRLIKMSKRVNFSIDCACRAVKTAKNQLAPPQICPDPLGDPMYVESLGLVWSFIERGHVMKGLPTI